MLDDHHPPQTNWATNAPTMINSRPVSEYHCAILAHYEDLEEEDVRIQYMWQALNSFSNEDRSRFLRFVTGRRRLPAPLYICPDKG